MAKSNFRIELTGVKSLLTTKTKVELLSNSVKKPRVYEFQSKRFS